MDIMIFFLIFGVPTILIGAIVFPIILILMFVQPLWLAIILSLIWLPIGISFDLMFI